MIIVVLLCMAVAVENIYFRKLRLFFFRRKYKIFILYAEALKFSKVKLPLANQK